MLAKIDKKSLKCCVKAEDLVKKGKCEGFCQKD